MCTISLFTISAPKMSQCTFTLLLSVSTDQTGFWVGLSDENQESVFRWLNGDVLMYNEWGRQPDEPQGEETENCVAIFNRGLVDASYSTWVGPKSLCSDAGMCCASGAYCVLSQGIVSLMDTTRKKTFCRKKIFLYQIPT